MCPDAVIRRLAGTMVLLSLALGWLVHPGWFVLTALVGVNLLQSTFTGWCLAERIFGRLGVFGCRSAA